MGIPTTPRTRNNAGVNLGGLGMQAIPDNPIFISAAQPASQPQAPTIITHSTSTDFTSTTTTTNTQITDSSAPSPQPPAPPLVLVAMVPLRPVAPRPYNPDTLTLTENTLANGRYVPIAKAGISVYRPEILSVIDFQPILDRTGLAFTGVGKLFDINYQTRMLRKNTLDGIFLSIGRSTNSGLVVDLNTMVSTYTTETNALGVQLHNFGANIVEVNTLEKAFEIKDFPDSAFNTERFLTLKNFFTRKMQYPAGVFDTFSETKILQQLLFDLRTSLENCSLSLLNATDPDRATDISPTTLDKTITSTFAIDGIRSSGTPRNAQDDKVFSDFVNSLPTSPDDRLKLLVHLLSKELRVSKGLSRTSVRNTLTTTLQANPDGNPFDNIIGTVGATIFDAPLGINSLSALLFQKIDNENFVLPFENKYIDDVAATYIPGNKYYVDTILNSVPVFNLDTLVAYSNKFSTTVSTSRALLQQLFGFKERSNPLLPSKVLGMFANAIKTTLQGARTSLVDPLVSLALFKLVSSDKILRRQLFKFLVLAGVATGPNGDERGIFPRAFKDTGAPSGDLLRAYFDELERQATVIEARVVLLTRASNKTLSDDVPPPVDRNNPTITLGVGAVKNALMSCVAGSTGTTNLFKEFIQLARTLDQHATIDGNELSYTLLDSSGRTRYNYVSSSFLLLIMFEVFVAYAGKYTSGEFVQNIKTTQPKIKFSTGLNDSLVEMIRSAITNNAGEETLLNGERPEFVLGGSARQPTTSNNKDSSFTLGSAYMAVLNKVEDEDLYLDNAIHIFEVIASKLTQSTRHAQNYFGQASINQSTRLSEQIGHLNENQIKVSTHTFESLRRDPGVYRNSDMVSVDERNAVVSLLSDSKFINQQTKILAVGIPAGFVDFLSGRLKKSSLNANSFKNNNQDLVKVKVYCRMSEFDDIAFLPQEFLFDMSLFYSPLTVEASVYSVTSLGSLLANPFIKLDDYTTGEKTQATLPSIIANAKYKSLNFNQQNTLFYNHLASGLLGTFVSLTTGMRLTEDVFTIVDPPPTEPLDVVQSIVRRYFSEVKGIPLPSGGLASLLTNPNISEPIKDELKLLLYGNVVFKTDTVRHKILNPKLFDRVFIIPVNLNNFVVDSATTRLTATGRQAIESTRFKSRAIHDLNTTIPRESFVFDDLFVSVETVD